MEQKLKKNFYIAIILVLVLALIGFAYAFFVDTIIGNDTSSRNIVKSGNIELTLSTTNIMSKDNFIPGDTILTTFTVRNTGTNETSYKVYFSKLYNTFINDDILYTLTCTASSGSCDSTAQLPLGTDYEQQIIQNTIGTGITHTYILVITYLERSSEQDYNKGNMFGFTIKINETEMPVAGTLKGAGGSWSYTGEYYAYKSSITSAIFEDKIDLPSDAISSWDVSSDGTSKVMSYIKSDGVSGYVLHIQFDYKVYAPANSSALFYNFSKLTKIEGLEYFDTSKATNMSSMFSGCSSIKNIDLGNYDILKVTSVYQMFYNCTKLALIDLRKADFSNITYYSNYSSMIANIPATSVIIVKNNSMVNWFSNESNCILYYNITPRTLNTYNDTNNIYSYKSNIKSLTFDNAISIPGDAVSSWDVSLYKDNSVMAYVKYQDGQSTYYDLHIQANGKITASSGNRLFASFTKLTTINNISMLDTSAVTNMYEMFYECNALTTLDLTLFNTSNVVNMSEMFVDCYALTTLNFSNFNTSNVKTMQSMFYGIRISKLDLSSFTSSKLTTTSYMYYSNSYLNMLDIRNIDFTSVQSSTWMFNSVPDSAIIYVKDNAVKAWMASHFSNLTNVVSVGNDSNVLIAYYSNSESFYAYKSYIKTITFDNQINVPSDAVSSWDVSVNHDNTVKAYIKYQAGQTTYYDLHIQASGTIYIQSGKQLFNGFSSLTTISNINILNTTNTISLENMFSDCPSLTSLDLSTFNTSKVKDISGMFGGDSSLTSVNLSSFNTSLVTDMAFLFSGCTQLTTIDLSTFNTSLVNDMTYMFYNTNLLATLNLHSASFTSVSSYYNMFANTKTGIAITVKDGDAQTFINARLTDASKSGTVTIG